MKQLIEQYMSHGSKKLGSSPKTRFIGQMGLLLGAIGLIIIVICNFTVADFDFMKGLKILLNVGAVVFCLYVKTIVDSVQDNMTEEERKAQLLDRAKERDAEFEQYKLIFSGLGVLFFTCLCSYFSFSYLGGRNYSLDLELVFLLPCSIVVSVFMIHTGVKNMREMRQILEEEAAGKLDYLKHKSNEQPNYTHDSAFDGQVSQINSVNSASSSGTDDREPKPYDSIQF